jgi:hypothetical protein
VAEENNSSKLKGRREDYKKVFGTEEGKKVLKDLEVFCLYNEDTFDNDALFMAYKTGLRKVYLHIKVVMDMDIEELEKISKAMTRET